MVATGTRFGPYQIESLLGAGGMGEVYRATDTVLGRQVAIKILPADVSRDPERTARFRREAKILASLNHSNIGAIYGVESAENSDDAPLGLVLELIEGPTLADRFRSGALPLDEAVAGARQIADALDAAHQQGVVHRDLKPGNIKVRDDGVVKVLDFGLARVDHTHAEASSGRLLADSPTITTPAMTAAGVLLGTAAYMSPEQAKGRPADKRSDIWAFGCVFYEMLTGTRAFGGNDVADTLASVLREEPDYTRLPRDTPDAVRVLLRGCLTKDRHRRIGDVSAVRFVLDNLPHFTAAPGVAASTAARQNGWRRASWPLAAVLLFSATTGAVVWRLTRPEPAPITRYTIAPLGSAALQIDGIARDLAILPNGAVVYKAVGSQGSSQLFLRGRDQIEPTALVMTVNPRGPFSSPDGERVGFIDVGAGGPELKTVSVSGGSSMRLANLGNYPSSGATWGEDERIVFATSDPATGLLQVPANGGQTIVLTTPDAKRGEGDHIWPVYLPGGRNVLFTIAPSAGTRDMSRIAVLETATKTIKDLELPGNQAQYSPTGHIVYEAGGSLFAAPFDPRGLEVTGAPTPLGIEVRTLNSGVAEFVISRNGALAYIPAGAITRASRTFAWVDRQADETPIQEIPPGEYMHPRLSPDETRLAFSLGEQQTDVWVFNFARGTRTPLTLEPGLQIAPTWLDDQHIAYASLSTTASPHGTVFRRAVDGSGDAEPLHPAAQPLVPSSSHHGTLLAWTLLATSDILAVNLDEHKISTWFAAPFIERNGEISPDGRWVAYEAADPRQSLQLQVYVRPSGNPSGSVTAVTTDGGRQPLWSRDGTELFYVGADGWLYSVPVEPGPAFAARAPRRLLEMRSYRGGFSGVYAGRMYDVTRDGRRFLVIKDDPKAMSDTAGIIVAQGWTEELKRLTRSN
ncbi:MAG TPA: protein kinase [Vicinamibacterales bacterium]|nr:protein kinase [Vicinamibacterales bacterium]